MNVVYCLATPDDRYTYVGATKNLKRRLRQHNGEIKGGTKYTRRSKSWRVLFYLEGFANSPDGWKETLSCEWHLKHVTKYRKGTSPVARRWRNAKTLLRRDRWSHIRLKKITPCKKQTTMGASAAMSDSLSNCTSECGKPSLHLADSDDEDARSVASALYEEENDNHSEFKSIPVEVPPATQPTNDPTDSCP